jgi:hypothetical protein
MGTRVSGAAFRSEIGIAYVNTINFVTVRQISVAQPTQSHRCLAAMRGLLKYGGHGRDARPEKCALFGRSSIPWN